MGSRLNSRHLAYLCILTSISSAKLAIKIQPTGNVFGFKEPEVINWKAVHWYGSIIGKHFRGMKDLSFRTYQNRLSSLEKAEKPVDIELPIGIFSSFRLSLEPLAGLLTATNFVIDHALILSVENKEVISFDNTEGPISAAEVLDLMVDLGMKVDLSNVSGRAHRHSPSCEPYWPLSW